MTPCSICGLPGHVIDWDHDGVVYCDLHADERLVCGGNHEHIVPTLIPENAS